MVRAQHPLQIRQQLPGPPDGLAGITGVPCPEGYGDLRRKRFEVRFTNFDGESLPPASPSLDVLDRDHRSSVGQARDDV